MSKMRALSLTGSLSAAANTGLLTIRISKRMDGLKGVCAFILIVTRELEFFLYSPVQSGNMHRRVMLPHDVSRKNVSGPVGKANAQGIFLPNPGCRPAQGLPGLAAVPMETLFRNGDDLAVRWCCASQNRARQVPFFRRSSAPFLVFHRASPRRRSFDTVRGQIQGKQTNQ